jgi:hypothetical protein
MRDRALGATITRTPLANRSKSRLAIFGQKLSKVGQPDLGDRRRVSSGMSLLKRDRDAEASAGWTEPPTGMPRAL